MLSGRGLCNGSIPRPEESNRVCVYVCVCVCVLLSVIIYNSNSAPTMGRQKRSD